MGSGVVLAWGASWWKRERVSNVVIDPRDKHCSKIKVMLQGAKCEVPYQVHYPGNFGSTGIDDLNYTLIIIVELNALGFSKAPPQMACNINCI